MRFLSYDYNVVLVFSGPVNVDSFQFTASGGGGGATPTLPPVQGKSAFTTIEAESFDSNSSSSMQIITTPNGGNGIGYIENGNTATYRNIDFGNGATEFRAYAASAQNSTIQLRQGSANGTLIGTLSMNSTGGWDNYQNVTTSINNVTGVKDLVLVFSGAVNIDSFVFTGAAQPTTPPEPTVTPIPDTKSAFSNIQAEDYDSCNASNVQTFSLTNGGNAIGYIENGNAITFEDVDFEDGAVSFKANAATQYATSIQIRTDSVNGPIIGTLSVNATGSFDTYREITTNISNVTGIKDLVLVFSGAVNLDWFVFSKSGTSNPQEPDYTGKKLVALTFDDGPNTSTTTQVLDILERQGVVATFFLIGNNINESVRGVMQRQIALGCELANHSFSHSDMSNFSYQQANTEITNTNNSIYNMVGVTSRFFRPPYISTSNTMYQAIDLPFICGSTHNDWDNNTSAQQRASSVLSNVQDGDIILLHDFAGNNNTVQALDTIIQGLKDRGFALVTVSKLFELKGVNPNVEYKMWSSTY